MPPCKRLWLIFLGATIACGRGALDHSNVIDSAAERQTGQESATDVAPDVVRDALQASDTAANSSPHTSNSPADAGRGCTPPVAGAPCTADDKIECVACCDDRWTCEGGLWQRSFIGCLPTSFSCGDLQCMEWLSYCEISGGNSGPAQYACRTLPSGCGARCPTCDCLTQAGVAFSQCSADAIGEISVVK